MSAVYRDPMGPLDEIKVTPKWPDFVVLRSYVWGSSSELGWYAVTNTGRPSLPYFWLRMRLHEASTDACLLFNGRWKLNAAFAAAHPDGCPERH